MTLAERGMALINRVLPVTHGVTGGITYSRVSPLHSATAIPATFGRTLFNLQTRTNGSHIVWGDRDYLIEASYLAAFGTPKQGDRIVHDGLTFEVTTPEEGEPHWRWSDNTRSTYRIHTRKV